MPVVTKHEPGMFSWADCGTTDVDGAKKFYGALFGWTYRDDPMGEGAFYSAALLDGHEVCALYRQKAELATMGVPPHWSSYITVENADEAQARAEKAGGRAVMPAFDVFDAGRMVALQDPTGGILCAWQPKRHIGAHVVNQAGALCWTELMTNDTDVAGRFYIQTFGWTTETMTMPGSGPYTVFKAGDVPAAGMMAFPPELAAAKVPPCWTVYFAVTGCDATAAKAAASGGKVVVPPTDIPSVGRFAILEDPQKVAFAILQPAPR